MPDRILVVRLGAMGDIIHTLPAVATLRRSFPRARITWLVESRWRVLLDGNPAVDEVAEFDRAGGFGGMWRSARVLRSRGFDLGIDFQGLIKSAAAMRLAGPGVRWGQGSPRERVARSFYTDTAEVGAAGRHIVEQHLELVGAAGGGDRDVSFAVPAGRPEGVLPEGPFVLASPWAGWVSKQWPLENYAELARMMEAKWRLPLVLNVPPGQEVGVALPIHVSGIAGLIDATRRAVAVVGVDSGPLHLAAALGKPGVAIFGPTDPARNGPYGGSMRVLRVRGAETSYRREGTYSAAMSAVTPEEVLGALGGDDLVFGGDDR
jgi:heptosyltransferase-1